MNRHVLPNINQTFETASASRELSEGLAENIQGVSELGFVAWMARQVLGSGFATNRDTLDAA